MSVGERMVKSKQAKYCVTVVVVGAGLFIVASSLGRTGHILTAISILGSVLFLVGTFTLLLVLIGVTSRPSRKSRRAQQTPISYTDASGLGYEHLYLNSLSQPESSNASNNSPRRQAGRNQWQRETHIINLPECPKTIVPVQVQPPPSYEEAIAMSHREKISTSNTVAIPTSLQKDTEYSPLPSTSN